MLASASDGNGMALRSAESAPLGDWRQGDVLSVPPSVLGNLAQSMEDEVQVAVVSQSCDVVREDREWIVVGQVAQLKDKANLARRGSMPRFVALPGLGSDAFIDLDLVTSVKKSDLVGSTRIPGVDAADWQQVRHLSRGIGRKFSRFAFPDAVVPWFDPLRPYFEKRHDRNSAVGRVLRAISELRVEAEDWSRQRAEVLLHVIVCPNDLPEADDSSLSDDVRKLAEQDNPSLESICSLLRPAENVVRGGMDGAFLWDLVAKALAALCVSNADLTSVDGAEDAISTMEGLVSSEAEFSLSKYRRSEMLDLDH